MHSPRHLRHPRHFESRLQATLAVAAALLAGACAHDPEPDPCAGTVGAAAEDCAAAQAADSGATDGVVRGGFGGGGGGHGYGWGHWGSFHFGFHGFGG